MNRKGQLALLTIADKGYLSGFLGLVNTLKKSSFFSKIPLIVFSEDKEFLEMPEVKERSFEQVFLDNAFVSQFEGVGVQSKLNERQKMVARKTFHKFLVFQDHGYDFNLFLDSDLLFLNDLKSYAGFLKGQFDIGLVKAQTKAPSIYDANRSVFSTRLRRIVREIRRIPHRVSKGDGYNTGVLLASKAVQTGAFFTEIVEYAKKGSYRHDQHCLNVYLRNENKLRVKRLPWSLNVNKSSLLDADQAFVERKLRDTVFLHYTRAKPWSKTYDSSNEYVPETYLDKLWIQKCGIEGPIEGGGNVGFIE